jgi:electron transport complex protein RnfE
MSLIKQDDTITLDTFFEGIWRENPVFVMMLGMCPTLAVTTSAMNAVAMGLATTFVLIASSLLVSMFRNLIPGGVRIATYIVIISTFVTLVDYIMQAYSQTLYNAMGAYIQLIVVNCIILGRAEACAARHKPLKSMVNATGMGLGFTLALLCLGGVREILGSGALFGLPLFGDNFQPWVIMVLPPGGFLVLGGWLMFFEWLRLRKQEQTLKVEGAAHEH